MTFKNGLPIFSLFLLLSFFFVVVIVVVFCLLFFELFFFLFEFFLFFFRFFFQLSLIYQTSWKCICTNSYFYCKLQARRIMLCMNRVKWKVSLSPLQRRRPVAPLPLVHLHWLQQTAAFATVYSLASTIRTNTRKTTTNIAGFCVMSAVIFSKVWFPTFNIGKTRTKAKELSGSRTRWW